MASLAIPVRDAQAQVTQPERTEHLTCDLFWRNIKNPDCSSYTAFFETIKADCRVWGTTVEAYLEREYFDDSGARSGHAYNFACRDTARPFPNTWGSGRFYVETYLSCPAWGSNLDIASRSCIGPNSDADTNSCSTTDGLMVGNPILPPTAEKYQPETDYIDAAPGGLNFNRTYRSNRGLDSSRPSGPLGKTWTHNHSLSLAVATSSTSGTSTATLTAPEGTTRTFTQANATAPWVAVGSPDTLVFTPGATAPWTYRRADDDSTARLDGTGRLVSLTQRNGWTTTYTYNASGQLTLVASPFSRTLTLAYNAAGLLASLTTADGRVLTYGYDSAARLVSVTYPDAKTRTYLYENPAFPHALTIWSMHLDPPRHEMRIEFKGPQEGASTKLLHVTGVEDFVATEMRLLNIVDRVVSYSPEDFKRPDGEGARLLFNLMRGRDPLAPDLEWPAYQIKLASVRTGALTLFEMQPVYGASMVVLAERFTLED